jgi:GntR family transcriptional regulator/MocR family aminotransferase
VLECYGQLQAEGFLTARAGSGTRVAPGAQVAPAPPVTPAPAGERLAVDFLPGVPDLTGFPRNRWASALRDACRTATPAELGYGDLRGVERLRTVLAGYLRRVRATVAGPDQIMICTGFAQGIDLVLRSLARGGVGRVAFEDPGDPDYPVVCARAGLEAVPVGVDDSGIDVAALARSGARVVILTPTHQFPTGVALAADRRQALVRWAQERDATIIEDDYDAEFRYDRAPVGALQGLAPDHVVLIGTASKSLAPGLRLAWILPPAAMVEALTEEKLLSDRGSPSLEQLALATLIESGGYDRHLRRMRRVYGARRDALIRALASRAPHVVLTGLAAGFHAVAHLPDGADEHGTVAGARARSVGLYPMASYRAGGAATPPRLVLGFGNLSEASIIRGIDTIADLL